MDLIRQHSSTDESEELDSATGVSVGFFSFVFFTGFSRFAFFLSSVPASIFCLLAAGGSELLQSTVGGKAFQQGSLYRRFTLWHLVRESLVGGRLP